jgi:hypothetical protein
VTEVPVVMVNSLGLKEKPLITTFADTEVCVTVESEEGFGSAGCEQPAVRTRRTTRKIMMYLTISPHTNITIINI